MRYYPEIKWSKSWVYNLFRLWEICFGRKVGIRREASAHDDGVRTTYKFYTLEAALCFVEGYIRSLFKFSFLPIKQLQLASVGLTPSPYLFSIAFDTSVFDSSSGSSRTFAYVVSGSNPCIFVGEEIFKSGGAGDQVSTISYAGTNLAQHGKTAHSADVEDYLYGLTACATGSNNVIVTCAIAVTEIDSNVVSYSGVKQTGLPDATVVNAVTTASSITATLTTVADLCWLVGYFKSDNNWSNGVNTTLRRTTVTLSIADSNGGRPPGSNSLNLTCTSAPVDGVTASFAPALTGNLTLLNAG